MCAGHRLHPSSERIKSHLVIIQATPVQWIVLSRISQILKAGGFRRNLLTMLTGTSIAQALGLLFLPVLTRVYSPEAFGRFGMFYATICVLGVLATWRMEMAVMLPKEEREARQIWKSTLWLLSGTSALFAIMLLIPFTPETALQMGVGLFLIGGAEALMLWHNRKQHFKILAAKNVIERISVTALAFVFAWWGFLESGLIWAQLATLFVIVGYMLYATFPDSPLREHVSATRVKELVSHYRDFPLMQGWSMLFVIGSAQLPNLFFGWRFDLEATGNVNLAYRIFEAPVNLFAISFAAAFYQHISHLPQSEIGRLFRKSVSKLTILLLPLFVIIGATGPYLFPLVFGAQWEHAGDFAIPLAAATFFKILYMSHSSALLVSRKLGTDMKVSGAVLLAQVLGFYVTAEFTDSPLVVVSVMSALTCLAFVYGLLSIRKTLS
jgi:O-antigen/teichoic acid export membrane protein